MAGVSGSRGDLTVSAGGGRGRDPADLNVERAAIREEPELVQGRVQRVATVSSPWPSCGSRVAPWRTPGGSRWATSRSTRRRRRARRALPFLRDDTLHLAGLLVKFERDVDGRLQQAGEHEADAGDATTA